MTLFSIWTGAWTSRAGMLAEMLSFFLIAPEILGPARLRRFERQLRQWNPGSARSMLRGDSRLPRLLVVLYNAVLAGGATVLLVLIAAGVSSPVPSIVPIAVLGCLAVPVLGALILAGGRIRPTRRVRLLVMLSALPLMITYQLLLRSIIGAVLGLAWSASWVTEREDRLRALVFGTGIVLLFGGVGAQFLATF